MVNKFKSIFVMYDTFPSCSAVFETYPHHTFDGMHPSFTCDSMQHRTSLILNDHEYAGQCNECMFGQRVPDVRDVFKELERLYVELSRQTTQR